MPHIEIYCNREPSPKEIEKLRKEIGYCFQGHGVDTQTGKEFLVAMGDGFDSSLDYASKLPWVRRAKRFDMPGSSFTD